MATVTPRRSTRIPHQHTPKMSERKKGLFQGVAESARDSLTQHRRLPVVDSESDNEDCDLGIISTLDSSSGDEQQEQAGQKTPERQPWHETRSHTKRLLKESNELKNFIKSPFTLNKFRSWYSFPDSKCTSVSTPVTPHLHHNPGTPSSTHSCASAHTTSSTSSRARKSLASLIADTESCSSSLKDLNFDSDTSADSKENTPTKDGRKSCRKLKTTPKFANFKGILSEQNKNNITSSPIKMPVVCLTKMDFTHILTPTKMLKTPNTTTDNNTSPPKIHHNRRSIIEIAESPEESCDSEKSYKRLCNDSLSDYAPHAKYPKLDTSSSVPKARLSLFNSDKLKEILSAKSFYGKKSPELNTSFVSKMANAIVSTTQQNKRSHSTHSYRRRSRKPGQINLGVKHKIRKPKVNKHKTVDLNKTNISKSMNESSMNNSTVSGKTLNNSSMASLNTSQEDDKQDPFDSEKQTIDALLSQWTEEEVPESELVYSNKNKTQLHCFDSSVIAETNAIFEPVTAVPVKLTGNIMPNSEVIVELGNPRKSPENEDVVMNELDSHVATHGEVPKGFLPVEGGYILVDENVAAVQEDLPDLDEIERELQMLDEQILQMAKSNNINAEAVLAVTETAPAQSDALTSTPRQKDQSKEDKQEKLFPIFSNPNPGLSTPSTKSTVEPGKKPLLKTCSDQYVIDAGQKRFGVTQCNECGVIYQIGEPQDEHDHLVHHNATDVLKFNGWKEERVVGNWDTGRCICVRGGEANWKRVDALLSRIIHPQLGYGSELPKDRIYCYSAYLYIEKKQIIGCLIVEPKVKAYKLIPGDPDCCSVESYPVKCGVSRIWSHINHRRRGIAARMLDCARASFLYGEALTIDQVAFSAPTNAGKALATKYCGTENFYVYLD